MSLRRRLTLLSAAAVALAVALASVITYVLVRDQLLGQIDDTLSERADTAIVAIRNRERGRGLDRTPGPGGRSSVRLPPPPPLQPAPLTQIVDASGSVTQGSLGASIPVSDRAREVAAGQGERFFADVTVDGVKLRVLTTPIGPDSALQVARPLDEVEQTLSDLRLILLAVSAGGVALAAGLGLLVARGALSPAVAVSGAAEEVARTRDLTRRIEVRGSDEIGRLAESFNEMMAALEASESARRQLVTDASHELRTPLATLRTNIETLSRSRDLDEEERGRIVDDLAVELEELSGLVGDVVELARESDQPRLAEVDVRLDEVAAAAVERARRRARGLRFEISLDPWLVHGDPARLDRAIWNLLDNAIKWSPPGGEVEVEVSGGAVAVRDRGPGFGEADLAHAFDRFYRADQARGKPGSGLGLAIVRRVAEQHGGTARVANRPGGGAEARIELPGEPLEPRRAAS